MHVLFLDIQKMTLNRKLDKGRKNNGGIKIAFHNILFGLLNSVDMHKLNILITILSILPTYSYIYRL